MIEGNTNINMVEKPQNLFIFQYFPGPLTKFQYIQGLEFLLSNSSIFQVFQDVYEPCSMGSVTDLEVVSGAHIPSTFK